MNCVNKSKNSRVVKANNRQTSCKKYILLAKIKIKTKKSSSNSIFVCSFCWFLLPPILYHCFSNNKFNPGIKNYELSFSLKNCKLSLSNGPILLKITHFFTTYGNKYRLKYKLGKEVRKIKKELQSKTDSLLYIGKEFNVLSLGKQSKPVERDAQCFFISSCKKWPLYLTKIRTKMKYLVRT